MKSVSMSGSLRENVGKKDAKALRNSEKVPCVLYGGTNEQVRFSVEEKAFKPLLFTAEVKYVDLEIAGKKTQAILQDIQYHPVSDKILHADFLELNDQKPIVMSIPVHTKGTSPGVLQGGKLITKIRKMRVKALPQDMPENITVDISKLEIAQSTKVAEVSIPNATVLESKNSVVVFVKPTRASSK